MDKELALRTFGYLIGHYKTHDKTIINSQEIEAIEFILKNNKDLEQQCKKQKEVFDRVIDYINSNPNVFYDEYLIDVETLKNNEMTDEYVGEIRFISTLLDILNEVSK